LSGNVLLMLLLHLWHLPLLPTKMTVTFGALVLSSNFFSRP
jgi:hypothetical protein